MRIAAFATCLTLLITTFAANRQAVANRKVTAADKSAKVKKPKVPNSPHREILSTLNELANTQNFTDDGLRFVILCEIADMLWSYDEARARRLFEETFRPAMAPKPIDASMSLAIRRSFAAVQAIVIQTIVSRDPAFAVKLAESLPDPAGNIETQGGTGSHRIDVRHQIAFRLLLRNPENAVQVAKLLADKFHLQNFIVLLGEIRRRSRDPQPADELFTRALERAKVEQIESGVLNSMASYMFPKLPSTIFPKLPANGADPAPLLSNAIVEQFLNLAMHLLARKVEGGPSAAYDFRLAVDYRIFSRLVPFFDRFMPHNAAFYRDRLDELRGRVTPEGHAFLAASDAGTMKELLAAGDAITDQHHKDALYQQAAIQAIQSGNFEPAATIVNKIGNESLRVNTAEHLRLRSEQHRSQQVSRAIAKSDFLNAEELIATNPEPRSRLEQTKTFIRILMEIDRARGLQILDSAGHRVLSIEDGVDRTQQLLSLAAVNARIDPERGFEEVRRAVDEFNRAGFVAAWDKYQENGTTSETNKLARSPQNNQGLRFLHNDEAFYWLGFTDLQRALAVARRLEMPEASTLAQLRACRGALRKVEADRETATPQKRPHLRNGHN